MLDTVIQAATLVRWILVLYSWMHVIAFLLSWIHADPTNPFVYHINRLTMPLWDWVRYHLPDRVAPLAPYFALMLILFLEIFLPGMIRSLGAVALGEIGVDQGLVNISFYFVIGGLSILENIIWFVFLLAVIWFIMTLVNPPLNHPIVQMVMMVVDPFITPLQRFLPRASIDLSPVVLALLCFVSSRLIGFALVPVQIRLVI
ncbi:MAG: YggT family protein [Deltaproteobacteria bacterium]|nr:YggT family protein [Deltaproteobacteria bacterium]